MVQHRPALHETVCKNTHTYCAKIHSSGLGRSAGISHRCAHGAHFRRRKTAGRRAHDRVAATERPRGRPRRAALLSDDDGLFADGPRAERHVERRNDGARGAGCCGAGARGQRRQSADACGLRSRRNGVALAGAAAELRFARGTRRSNCRSSSARGNATSRAARRNSPFNLQTRDSKGSSAFASGVDAWRSMRRPISSPARNCWVDGLSTFPDVPLLAYTPAFHLLQAEKWFQPILAAANFALRTNSTHALLAAARPALESRSCLAWSLVAKGSSSQFQTMLQTRRCGSSRIRSFDATRRFARRQTSSSGLPADRMD